MRIVQLIDSLETGGAERMAVNYANALTDNCAFSGLIATRKEGGLKTQLHPKVNYLFLERKTTFDIKAVWRLKSYVQHNKVTHIHAHSSSFLLAVMLKLIYPKVLIVWHDHYGNSEFLDKRSSFVLKLCSFFFHAILVVNEKLKLWAEQKMWCKKIAYFPNFVNFETATRSETVLKGVQGKRIVCLANLRAQKNHELLLQVASELKEEYQDWTFHLVGKDFEDEYAKKIKDLIISMKLQENVFIYGSKNDIGNILQQAAIGVLTSKSEGLPVALLEYGFYKLPVVVTSVGEIPTVVKNNVNGLVVSEVSVDTFAAAMKRLMTDVDLRDRLGQNLQNTVTEEYTEKALLDKYLLFIQ